MASSRSPRIPFLIALGVLLLTAACGDDSSSPTAAAGAENITCDAPAVAIGLGMAVESALEATSDPYPATATYYCVGVPPGTDRVTIDLTGLSADLDLYVGFGSIESVQGFQSEAGETYDWLSNQFGTADEHVEITDPEAGVYYIEVVSYAGEASAFTLRAAAG
ncbi:MAG: hypothetical protein A2V75_04435 [Actinobacteria bacterium RBG_16_70_17]|nr:MAG: hypothetical protein A2V75_04435 [Actinobacteria bacterium RBG_16_70_17]